MEEPRVANGEQTQDLLLAAKWPFVSQGFAAIPVRQIAREVGITPNRYPCCLSKDELLTAVLLNATPYGELLALFDQLGPIHRTISCARCFELPWHHTHEGGSRENTDDASS